MADITVLKQYLGLGDTTDRDTLLGSLADAAIGAISNELGYSVASHSVTQQSVGHTQIAFTDLPATSLVVKYREDLTDTDGTDDVTLTAWLDYYLFPHHIELKSYRGADPHIILSYNAGWSTLPEPIEQAVRLYVAYALRLTAQLQPGEIPDTRLPRECQQLIEPYKPLQLP